MIKNKFIKDGINFQCQGSSNCCVSRGSYGYVYLSNKDLRRFSKHFNISILDFKHKYCEYTNGFVHLKEIYQNGNCMFLKNKKCSVYKSRPTQCRTWPFWEENLNSKKWNNEIKNFCPGIGKGKKITFSQIVKITNDDIINDEKIIKERLD